MTNKAFRGLFLCAVAGALVIRIARLDLRPMHHDEANQAVKFGALLERGEYQYDPRDHHGPSLYYLTVPAALATSGRSFAALSETDLRLVPALFGTAILLLLLLLAGGLAREAIFFAALLAALSPAMTYYSRFYIQETLLVFFLAGLAAAGWKYTQTRSGWWAAAAGFSAGMMYATKETSIILFGTLAAALVLERQLRPKTAAVRPAAPLATALHAGIFLVAAFLPAWLLFTSFLRNPGGLTDSVSAFGTYFARAGAGGLHAHPWYYYFQMLVYSRFGRGPVWSEAFVLALAIAGTIPAFGTESGRDGHPRFLRVVFFYTALTAIIFSLIPYKTPWNVLPFYLGLLILAGNGAAVMWRAGRFLIIKAVVLTVMLPGLLSLAYQDYRANFVDYANPSNPYVYAQTSPDFLKVIDAVKGVAAVSPEHERMLIKVVAPPEETWPLPWYLRRFERVGYWTDADAAGDLRDASVVISGSGPSDKVARFLGAGYQSSFYGLRPEVVLDLFIRQDLWESYLKEKASKGQARR